MEDSQSQTAPAESESSDGADASVPVRRDVYSEMLAAQPEADASADDGEAAPDAEPDAAQQDASPEAEPADADEADLASYPEAVRDSFRALTPEQRKALYEHAELRVSDRIETQKKRNDELAANQRQAEALRADIRSKVGKFIGTEGQTLTLGDGTTRTLPSYADLDTMLRSQAGRDRLYDQYGLSQDTGEAVRAEWDDRKQMLDAAAESMQVARLSQFDERFRNGIRLEGLDPSAMLDGASGPEHAAANLIRNLKASHADEIAQLKREHEARAAALNLNAEGLRGRVAAATSRRLPTGGRSAAATSEITLADYNAMPFDERQKLSAADRDAMMAREMARNGTRRR